jgi:hypothetical protein
MKGVIEGFAQAINLCEVALLEDAQGSLNVKKDQNEERSKGQRDE